MKYNNIQKVLMGISLILGLGGIILSLIMEIDPSIMDIDSLLPYFEELPLASTLFSDFIVIGFIIFVLVGITNIISGYYLFKRTKAGLVLSIISAIILIILAILSIYIISVNTLLVVSLILGVIQLILDILCLKNNNLTSEI